MSGESNESYAWIHMLTCPELREWMDIFEYVCRRQTLHVENGIHFVIHTRDHNPPHLHVSYQKDEVVLDISEGTVIKGSLSPKKLKKAAKWVRNNDAFLKSRREQLAGSGIVAWG